MTTDDKIRDEKLQYDINREASKISALSSGKICKYKYLTGEEILPSRTNKFAYSRLLKAFEKQTKAIEEQGKKQIKSLLVLKPDENKEDTNQLKDFFQKGWQLMKLKMK